MKIMAFLRRYYLACVSRSGIRGYITGVPKATGSSLVIFQMPDRQFLIGGVFICKKNSMLWAIRFLFVLGCTLCVTAAHTTSCTINQYSSNGTCTEITAGYYGVVLPDEYIELDYLESTGTQWIDTGVYVDSLDINGDIDFQYTEIKRNSWLAGAVIMDTLVRGTEVGLVTEDEFYTILGNTYSQPDVTKRTQVHFTVQRGIPNKNLYIFSRNFPVDEEDEASVKIFSATIYNGNSVLRNFVPAQRKSDAVLGMYDTVSGTFYINSGTGEFIAGNIVKNFYAQEICNIGHYCINAKEFACGAGTYSDTTGLIKCKIASDGFYTTGNTTNNPAGFTTLEYLESTGTQWIDTGVIVDSTDLRATIDFQFTQNIENTWIAGATTYPGLAGVEGGIYKGELYTLNGFSYSSSAIMDRQTATVQTDSLSNLNFYVFGRNFPGDEDDAARAKIYSVQIYDGNTLIRNLVPVRRDSDGTLGMYDTVNNVFYTNSGTGTFVAGADVVEVVTGATGQSLCPIGYYCTSGAQSTCTNAPENTEYTATGWTNSNCPWQCIDKYKLRTSNVCSELCNTGITSLNTNTGILTTLWQNKSTTPSIYIQTSDNIICYADLYPGNATGTIHVEFEGQVYHTTH